MSQNDILGKIKLVVFIHLMTILLCACVDQSKDTSTALSNLDNLITPTPQIPVTSEPTIPGSPNQDISGNQFRTSSGGQIALTKISSFTIPKESRLLTIKSDSTSALYFYFSNVFADGFKSRTVNKFDLSTSAWSLICNFQDDASFGSGFELDDSYFYIFNFTQRGYSDSIRRFSRNDCGEISSIHIPQYDLLDPYAFFAPALSKDSDGLFSWICNDGSFQFNSATGLLNSWKLKSTVGSETFSLNPSTNTRNSNTWSLTSSNDYRSTVLWKYNKISASFSWSKIYTVGGNYWDLMWGGYISRDLIIPTEGNRLFVTRLSDGYGHSRPIIYLYEFDVGQF